jgi:chemotaxis signal transduction protein
MSAVVRFSTVDGEWAVDVAQARRVVPAADLIPLPEPRPGVAGLLRLDGEALPVLATLGAGGGQVLELEARGRRFGLLVDEVTAVLRDDQARVGPAPGGQDEEVVCGVVASEDGPALLVDAGALGRRLA